MSDDNVIDFQKEAEKRRKAVALANQVLQNPNFDSNEVKNLVASLVGAIESQEQLMGVILHDLMFISQKQQLMEQAQIKNAGAIAVMTALFKEKLNVTEEEFQAIWERDVLPQLKKLEELRMQGQTPPEPKEEPRIIVPEGPKIIAPQ